MTTKIERDFTFQSAVHFDSKFIMNLYTVTLTMYVETENMHEQNVAMERMKYYIYECLEGCVFIEDSETDSINKYSMAGLKVCTLPIEPYEQVICMLLLTKLNAIVEDRLTIFEAKILSKLSDGVTITYDAQDPPGPFEENGWWNNKKIMTNDLTAAHDGGKIVKLLSRTQQNWEDIGLSWELKSEESANVATVVPIREHTEN